MGLFDFKKKRDEIPLDPLKDLVLSKLRVGFYLDYDMKTWQVTGYNTYEISDRNLREEWELTSGREIKYLEKSVDDEEEWAFSHKIPIGAIEGDMKKYIMKHDDPPEKITFKDKTYFLDDSGAGYFHKDGKGRGIQFIFWEFVDESGENYVSIEQWGESEFEAGAGIPVEEYQFTHILPGE
jgi:hypothetical protein